MLVDFCLPVKNEEKILRMNALKLRDFLSSRNLPFAWRIKIIVNGSDDQSALIAKNLEKGNFGRLEAEVLTLPGKGRALKQIFSESRADILVYMDVDLAVSLKDLPRLWQPLLDNKADLAIGSRLLVTSRTSRSHRREIISRVYVFLSRCLLKHNFSDLQCGFKAVSREAFAELSPLLKDNYWFFDTELIVWAEKLNFRVVEIPVDWRENRYVKRLSSVNMFRDSFLFLKNLLILRYRLKKQTLRETTE